MSKMRTDRDVACLNCGEGTTYIEYPAENLKEMDQVGETDRSIVIGCTQCGYQSADPMLQMVTEYVNSALDLEDGPARNMERVENTGDFQKHLQGELDLKLLAEDVVTISVFLYRRHRLWLAEMSETMFTENDGEGQ